MRTKRGIVGTLKKWRGAIYKALTKLYPKFLTSTSIKTRRTNEKGIALIKEFEKCSLKAYLPTKNDRWTIGWGCTFIDGKPVQKGMVITAKKAEALFLHEIETLEEKVTPLINIPLTSNAYSAIISLCYNIGIGNFSKSTLLKKLNQNLFDEAANEFLRWNQQAGVVLDGLTKRRKKERDLFLTPELLA